MQQSALSQKLRTDRFFQLGVIFVALVVMAAAFAPWLSPQNPLTGDLKGAYLVSQGLGSFWGQTLRAGMC